MKFYDRAQDPISFLTHFIGAIFAVAGTAIVVISQWLRHGSLSSILSVLIFGLSMMALYSASSIYHYVSEDAPSKLRLRKLDHAMIYILIVGSYTPLCLAYMDDPRLFLGVIWSVAILGIIIKMIWMDAPRWLSTVFYLGLGWSILFDVSILTSMSTACVTLIAIGGISYSIGAIIYMIKKPNFTERFGFHELFHIFIMIGTFFHFIAIALYI